jgi:regulator of protease activity HflC (stomatin/prohibitin superfamily)
MSFCCSSEGRSPSSAPPCSSKGSRTRRAPRAAGIAGIIAGLALVFLSYAFVVIPAGHVGVMFNVFGGVQDRELTEGFHIVLPVLQQVTQYDVRQQEITLATSTGDQINARSSEGLDIGVDVTVLYQVVASEAAKLHQDIGPSYVASGCGRRSAPPCATASPTTTPPT